MAVDRRDEKDGELNVLDDILTEAPDQDDELYNPESEHDVNEKKGSKRKSDRGDNLESKRLRSTGHTTRQAIKRSAPSGGANGKKLVNTRSRHSSEYKGDDYHYDRSEDRKNHSVRGGGSRGDPPKSHSEKPLTRRREPDRRPKPLMPELSEKLRRTSEESVGRISHSSKEEHNSEEYASEQESGSSAESSEGNRSDLEEEEVMEDEEEEGEKGAEEEDDEEEDEEEEEGEEEEYELEEGDQREGNEQNDYDTRSEASDSQSESVSFSEGESVHSGSGSDASEAPRKNMRNSLPQFEPCAKIRQAS
ncbi:hypothetical protein ANANG_G00266110 [Anguilla anguilla]|uniref:Uncharacterized protein n=1 Tax=Anguilla anguilla TaxID=7936 RepID=A0A9D3LTH2_ANGAN|nr:hypothetical protein ANANG_G00266110 [Anguilla anguilla]